MYRIYLAALVMMLNGCSTIMLHKETSGSSSENFSSEYYVGTKFDAMLISIPFNCDKKTDACVLGLLWPVFGPLALIDLPFSMVADTVYLPFQYAKSSR